MRLDQLILFQNANTNSILTVDNVVSYAKDLFSEQVPYTVKKDIAGNEVILLNTHFIKCVRIALTDGCMDCMSRYEAKFWYEFVEYQNDIQDGIRNNVLSDIASVSSSIVQRELALVEMDHWINDELMGNTHLETKVCEI